MKDTLNSTWIDNLLDISSLDQFDILLSTLATIHEIVSALGDNASFQPQMLISDDKIYELNAEIFSSIDNTLKSIFVCSKMANFSDATVLVRKYRDDLFQWLFIIQSISDIEESKLYEFMKQNDISQIGEIQISELYNALSKWFNSSIKDEEKNTVKLKYFDIEKYRVNLCRQSLLQSCFDRFLNPIWNNLNIHLNDYTHINGIKYIFYNNAVHNYELGYFKSRLTEISESIIQATTCFLSVLILIKPFYLISGDYIKCLENAIEPPDNSQYWIAPIIQKYIDNNIFTISQDLKNFLVENIPYGIEIG